MDDPPVPPALGLYAAAVTLALTTRDEAERLAAARLVEQISVEEFTGRKRTRQCRRQTTLRCLIQDLLRERLELPVQQKEQQ